jgi:hypothetical protein
MLREYAPHTCRMEDWVVLGGGQKRNVGTLAGLLMEKLSEALADHTASTSVRS